MQKRKFVLALVLFNAAAFVLTSLFLPSPGTFSYSDPISYFINSRTDWHLAFGVTLATSLISWGVYLIVDSFSPDKSEPLLPGQTHSQT